MLIVNSAHVRGGGEYGNHWYEQGSYLKKKNTFYDFIACCKFLVSSGYTSSSLLTIIGGSAGGMLIGAVINMEPEICNAAILDVPFVDVLNSMLDETLPLTVTEYDEWGNPKEKKVFDYMITYSPYDNIEQEKNKNKKYPAILLTGGMNDAHVQYWEPLKFTAKLRHFYTQKDPSTTNVILCQTNLEAGHQGASGRYERYKADAFQYAFILTHTNQSSSGAAAEEQK